MRGEGRRKYGKGRQSGGRGEREGCGMHVGGGESGQSRLIGRPRIYMCCTITVIPYGVLSGEVPRLGCRGAHVVFERACADMCIHLCTHARALRT